MNNPFVHETKGRLRKIIPVSFTGDSRGVFGFKFNGKVSAKQPSSISKQPFVAAKLPYSSHPH